MASNVRIDKWLWAVRIFKTRSLASEACKKGHVCIAGKPVKSSRSIEIGDTIEVRKAPITRKFRVKDLSEKRMGAKLVPGFMEDVTPAEELELLEMQRNMRWSDRDKGTGRPTKKDRRNLDDFFDW